MKIRFKKSWPCVIDKEGEFQLHCVNYGPSGFTLAEMVATGFKIAPPIPHIVICAVHNDRLRGSVGTRLCAVDYESGEDADAAMREGVEIVADSLAQSFANRAVAAKVAEMVG